MAESRTDGRRPWWRRHWLALTILVLIVLLAYAMLAATVLPGWIVSMNAGSKADDNTRLNAIANTRAALLGVLAPLVVAIGAVAAFLNYLETSAQNRRTVELSRETLDVTRRGQLTERFTKAIEQLGQTSEDKLDIRLGGIYALERIAKESKELHAPVMEILTAFLRDHSQLPQATAGTPGENEERAAMEAYKSATNGAAPRLRADFQATATVLGRREDSYDPEGFRLDLSEVDLSQANFADAKLQGANFYRARLHDANFGIAQLQDAYFSHAELQGANFVGATLHDANFGFAQLQDAYFSYAELQGANFVGARLHDANFSHAQLQGAYFMGAQLQGADFSDADIDQAHLAIPGDVSLDARGLTRTQLARARRNVDKAFLPDYLTEELESEPAVPPTD